MEFKYDFDCRIRQRALLLFVTLVGNLSDIKDQPVFALRMKCKISLADTYTQAAGGIETFSAHVSRM